MRTTSLPAFAFVLTACLGPGGSSSEPEPTPIGIPIGTPVMATIGASGGSLVSEDGVLTLEIPPGALAADTELSVVPLMNFAHGGLGQAYQLLPEGTTFAAPVTLRFEVDEASIVRSEIAGVGIASQSADGLWHWSDATYDAAAHTLSTETTHFSSWSLVEGIQLVPGGAVVPEGASLPISVVSCYAVGDHGDLAPLGYRCDEGGLAPLVEADEWAVDSVPGGNATVGTISGSGLSVTFHAPSVAPTPRTVRVSARVRGSPLGGSVLLFASIVIGEPHPLAGTVTVRQPQSGIDFTVTLDVDLSVVDDGIDETNWSAVGTATLSPTEFMLAGATCTANEPTQVLDEGDFLKARKDPTLALRFGSITGWDFTCRDGSGTEYPWFVSISGQTGHGLGCIVPDDVPLTNLESIDLTYTATCSPIGPAEIHWMLHRSD